MEKIYNYKGTTYPGFLKTGDAAGYIRKAAQFFCQGDGLDIGAGPFPMPGATPIDMGENENAYKLPDKKYDYIFSSHCLEHLEDPIKALEYWQTKLNPGAPLFLYLPHPDMEYWLPQNNRKHLHEFYPKQIKKLLSDLGFENVLNSERDFYWSFAVVGFMPDLIIDQMPETD
jgi:SAM-dependent methyltransferase